jgi:hypothetical protein
LRVAQQVPKVVAATLRDRMFFTELFFYIELTGGAALSCRLLISLFLTTALFLNAYAGNPHENF